MDIKHICKLNDTGVIRTNSYEKAERFPLYKDMTDVIRELIAKTPWLFVLRPGKLKTPYGMAMQAAVI